MVQQNIIERLFIKNIKQKNIENVVLANLIVLTALFLTVFIPVGKSFFAILLFLYLKVGLLGFVFEYRKNKVFRYKSLFLPLKSVLKLFWLFVVKLFIFLFWATFFIVPGIVRLLDYSFASLIIYECPDLDVKGVLMLGKELSNGHRKTMALSFLVAIGFSALCMLIMFLVIFLFDIWGFVPFSYYVVFIVFAGVFSSVILGLPTIQLTLVDCYISSKRSKQRDFKK